MNKVLPHEWLCLALLAWLLVQLVAAVGWWNRESLVVGFLLVVNCALVVFFPYGDSDRSWRLRMLSYAVSMNALYFELRTAIPAMNPELNDSALQAADQALVGMNLSLRLQQIVHPELTDVLSLCYMLFFIYLIIGQVRYLIDDLAVLKKYAVGQFSLYAVGYFGYSLVPALGPHVAMAGQFSTPLVGGWPTEANEQLVLNASIGVDAFPSLHCGSSLYLLLSDYQHRRWRFWVYVIPCVGLWLSTLYLRYHYFVDVFCGLALGWLSWMMANRITRGRLP